MVIAGFAGFGYYMLGMMWVIKNLGGWGVILWTAGSFILLIVLSLVLEFYHSRKAPHRTGGPNTPVGGT